jgi:hypothetical protein
MAKLHVIQFPDARRLNTEERSGCLDRCLDLCLVRFAPLCAIGVGETPLVSSSALTGRDMPSAGLSHVLSVSLAAGRARIGVSLGIVGLPGWKVRQSQFAMGFATAATRPNSPVTVREEPARPCLPTSLDHRLTLKAERSERLGT